MYYTAVGLEKCDREQTAREIRKKVKENRQTEKAITEATLIVDGSPGSAGKLQRPL